MRRAGPADAPGISRVHVESWRAAYRDIIPQDYLSRMSAADYEGRWRRTLDGRRGTVCVAESPAEGVVGFASGGLLGGRGILRGGVELHTLYVLPQYQGAGVGSQLFWGVVEELCGEGGCPVLVWVLGENPARRFYERLGGRLVGETATEVGGARLREVAYAWRDAGELRWPGRSPEG